MTELKQRWSSTLNIIRRERDELRVRMHLASAELRDEWEELERKWARLEANMKAARAEAGEKSRHTLDTPIGALVDEVKSAYRRIRRRFH